MTTTPTRSHAAIIQTFRIEVSRLPTHASFESSHHQRLTWNISQLYFVRGKLTDLDVDQLARQLLADPVTETYSVSILDAANTLAQHEPADHTVDVTLLPGVTDSAAENLIDAAHSIGLAHLEQAATGHRYYVRGDPSEQELHELAVNVFSNPVIQRYSINQPITPPFVPFQQSDSTVEVIALRGAGDDTLLAISNARRLSLNLPEMQAVRDYYRREGRDPTDVELEMLAQTWSEHCIHKTFKAMIDYADENGQQKIDGLLRTYIRGATDKVAKPWVRSAFVDNAGVIAFNDRWDLAFKVETHNHPSALEPFGGANTGVGGVVRDILGVSARPIANTDILCFGPQDLPDSKLPSGVLHPRRIAEGVIRGVEDYGNKMGIPTVNGAIVYHPGYTSNPLVFCGCLGILPRDSHVTQPQPGDLIVVIGGRTGRDGLRGATFSSMEMDHTTGEIAGSAVQIGHPIHEKQVQEVVLRARDARLYHAITDCGAGGLSSAVGEMTNPLGARVQLESVLLKYPGLRPWEIWLSEAQERMVLAVPPANWAQFQAICEGQDVEAVNIGSLETTGRLCLLYGDQVVGDLALDFLHDGIPQRHLRAEWTPPAQNGKSNLDALASPDLVDSLLNLLAHPNIRSKEAVIRLYDHEVQSGTAIKPMVGVDDHGPGDAAVLVPLDTHHGRNDTLLGVAISAGICPTYGEIDPYAMAWAAVDEAMRNIVAVGTDPDRVALLDNFCWGNANLPDRLGSLVRCAQGCYDAAVAYGVPFISGKDSLNNEYADQDGRRHAIPGTLLISAVGIVPDVSRTVTMDLKANGNHLYIVGQTRVELGGSHYALLTGDAGGGLVPQPVPDALKGLRNLHRAIAAELVEACHDCSEGGIGVALAEMCIAGRLGAEIAISKLPGSADIPDDAVLLYAESSGRFLVEVPPEYAEAFEQILNDYPHARIGQVKATGILQINGRQQTVSVGIEALETAWRGELPKAALNHRPLLPGGEGEKTKSETHRKSTHIGPPRVLILHASGTNRDRDAALACQLAGGDPEIVHVNQLLSGERRLSDYGMLVVPGGFSYGDDLGAGKLWAMKMRYRLGADMDDFVTSGRPVLGICNGFQMLVKAGLLPGGDEHSVTLTFNQSEHFECRWVTLVPQANSPCLFTAGLAAPITCPVAHGEGRIAVRDEATGTGLLLQGLVPLTYAGGEYPANPNGSISNIAALCNPAGNVMGLMPHPENHIFPWQHPRWHRGEIGMSGLRLFENGIRFA